VPYFLVVCPFEQKSTQEWNVVHKVVEFYGASYSYAHITVEERGKPENNSKNMIWPPPHMRWSFAPLCKNNAHAQDVTVTRLALMWFQLARIKKRDGEESPFSSTTLPRNHAQKCESQSLFLKLSMFSTPCQWAICPDSFVNHQYLFRLSWSV